MFILGWYAGLFLLDFVESTPSVMLPVQQLHFRGINCTEPRQDKIVGWGGQHTQKITGLKGFHTRCGKTHGGGEMLVRTFFFFRLEKLPSVLNDPTGVDEPCTVLPTVSRLQDTTV